jgi:hypothetical protein
LIAQSQQRIELGLPPSGDATSPINMPEFTPSLIARWINGIWFTSLGLSLSAALIAMLGKEWLTAFLSSRPRPIHSHALLRQSRLEGLERWWALHILSLLPSLLHASLLLFSVGLVIYLWTLDIAIAAVTAGLVGATSLFYLVTAVLGAVYDFCPYVTEISGYLRRAAVALFGRRRTEEEDVAATYTSVRDLQALLWLANNSRDPAIVDCSYQALAGLHRPVDKVRLYNADVGNEGTGPADEIHDIPMQLNEQTTMVTLLSTVVERFERLTTNQLGLSGGDGAYAARYATAVLRISTYLQRSGYKHPPDVGVDSQELGAITRMEKRREASVVDGRTVVSSFGLYVTVNFLTRSPFVYRYLLFSC